MVLEKESILSTSCWIYLGITHNVFKEEYANTESANRSKMDNTKVKDNGKKYDIQTPRKKIEQHNNQK
jgi:hypothetical protein